MHYFFYLLALLPFYLLGAMPSGKLLALKRGVRIEEHGSGNVGATNVARVLGKKAGLLTLILDIGKGALAVWIAHLLTDNFQFGALAGLAAVAGHCFSIPKVLRGGKGVATALGTNIVLAPAPTAVGLALFLLAFFLFRIVSLASVFAALSIPLVAMLFGVSGTVLLCLIGVSLIVTYRHKDNLRRIAEGREDKFSFAKADDQPRVQAFSSDSGEK